MAKLKKVLSQGSISNFRQVAPNGGAAFRHLAAGINAAYEGFLPGAMEEMKQRGAEVGDAIAKDQISMGGEESAHKARNNAMSASGGPTKAAASVLNGDWLEYANDGAIRDKPISDELKSAMSFLPEMGVTMKVISGGQDAEGGKRTGSTRHDHGGAADVDFYKDGRKLVSGNPDDEAILSQIVSRAKGNGVTGFGEGADYMGAGRVHLGFGTPAIWGAGGKGENAPEWLRKAYSQSGLGGPTASGISAPEQESTIVRTSEGKLEPRLYSPYSGPLLRAHNAAAGIAYQSEMIEKMSLDLMEMSSQFDLDPDGFNDAATEYADQLVSGAPDAFKADLREELDTEIHRRRLGLMEDKQKDTRQRAANSSKALVERWSQNYAEAVASGDQKEIEAARFKLDGLLQAREALPGLSWTEEQSVNVFMKAEEAGAKIIAESRKKIAKEHKDGLNLIIEAQKEGLSTDNEHILDDPEVAASNPELWREAMAWKTLNSQFPDFMKMTPADQKTVLAEIRNRGVSEEFEIDLLKAAESAAKDNAKAWRDDPVQQAEKTLGDVPSLTIEDPQQLSEDLAERAAYMAGLAEGGYADGSTILSGAEQEAFKAVFGKDTPIEIRAAMMGAAVRGLGPNAVSFFNQVGGDEVTMYVGKAVALGGDEKLAMDILRGQQMIDEGIVELPSKSVRIETINAEVAVALQGIPNGVQAQGEIMKATVARYALDAQGVDPDSEAGKALLSDALSKVLGQRTTPTGRKVGGIQKVMGQSTLLPMDQNGEEVEAAMRVMLGGTPMDTPLGMPIVTDPVMTETVWSAVSADGTAPRFNGNPILPRVVDADLIRMVSIGGSFYRMEYTPPGGEPKDIDNGNGDIFIFDLPKLMEAME